MKYHFVTALVLSLAFLANADEYEKKGPLVTPVSYEASHQLDREYEIGTSSFVLTADCQETEEAAKKAIAAKLAVVQSTFDTAIAALGLGERNEKLNYKLDNAVSVGLVSPVENKLDVAKEKYFWTNRCTGEQSEEPPVRVKKVTRATQQVTVWFPNTGKVLNSLSALVTQVEALTEKEPAGVSIVCNSKSGGNYTLGVSESTEKAAWTEIKRVAQERAKAKKDKDFAAAGYQAWWFEGETFQENGMTRVPQVSVEKKNGEWLATFSQSRNYTVYFKKASDPAGDAGQLTGQKNYSVGTESTGKSGLYGTLSITVSKGCAKDKAEAETSVAAVGAEILGKLRDINGGKKSETEALDVKDPVGEYDDVLVAYNQIKDKDTVNYYYNPCTLEKYEVTSKPEVQTWKGSQVLTITSSNLNALSDLRESLNKAYPQESEDPAVLKVETGVVDATATQATLEDAGSQLDAEAWDKFIHGAGEGSFKCDAGDYSFACLSQYARPSYESADFGGAMDSSPKAAAYSRTVSDVSSTERGAKRFIGKYSYNYTVRKVLKDSKR